MAIKVPNFAEKYTGNKYENLSAEDKILKCADVLERENNELNKQLKEFKVTLLSYFFTKRFKEQQEEVIESWLERVREETSFLEIPDSLGIELFGEDQTDQPGFPETAIEFRSQEVYEENVRNARQVGGVAFPGSREVKIEASSDALPERLATLLNLRKLDSTTEVLLHELIHIYHFKTNSSVTIVLTEAQAYFSGVLSVASATEEHRKYFESVSDSLIAEGGLYEFDHKQVESAMNMISLLYSAGLDSREISQKLVSSHYDPESKKFLPLSDDYDAIIEKHGLDKIAIDALKDVFFLHQQNQKLKAVKIMCEEILKRVQIEKFAKLKRKDIKGCLTTAVYEGIKGPVSTADLGQSVIILDTKNLPYDPLGTRTGILIGPMLDEDGGMIYSLSKIKTQGEEVFKAEKCSEQLRIELLAELKKNKGLLRPDFLAGLFYEQMYNSNSNLGGFSEIYDQLASDEVRKMISKKYSYDLEGALPIILNELSQINRADDQKAIRYGEQLEEIERDVRSFDLNLSKEVKGYYRKIRSLLINLPD